MDLICVATRESISGAEFRTFIESQSGIWFDDGIGGTVETTGARVFVSIEHEPGYDSQQVSTLTARLGGVPKTFVSIRMGSAPQSRKLAFDVASKLANRFLGVIDDNTGRLFQS